MSKCRDCELRILWTETPEGKKLPVDPRPSPSAGEFVLVPTNPDLPMTARKPTPEERRRKVPLYANHRKTCSESDYEEKSPSWVREPEGY